MARRYVMQKPRGPRGPYATKLKGFHSEIVGELARGASCRALARKYGCGKDAVARIRREYGLAS